MLVQDAIERALRDAEMRGLKSALVQRYAARSIRECIGSIPIKELGESQIEAFKEWQLAAGRSPSTINGKLSLLSRALKLAKRRGDLAELPEIERLPVRNIRTGFLRPEEFRRLWGALEVLDVDVADLVRWLYLTGWRCGEARRLTWEEVDLPSRTVELAGKRTKNGRPRRIRLPLELGFLFERRDRVRNGPFVFHRKGKPIKDFRHIWKRATEGIGRPGLLVHDLRRSFARNCVEAGVPQRIAMEIAGWTTTSVFHRYAITDEGQISRGLSDVFRYSLSAN